MSKNSYSGVDSYAAFFVAYKAKMLTRLPFFTSNDFEDLQQELMFAYLHAWPGYDPVKGDRRSFIKTVINTKALMIMRDAEREKRWSGTRPISLSSPMGEEDASTLGDMIDNDQSLWGDVFKRESHGAVEHDLDVHRMLSQMPEALRQTHQLLTEYSVTDAAALLGIPRTTMSSRLKKLKKYLDEGGSEK